MEFDELPVSRPIHKPAFVLTGLCRRSQIEYAKRCFFPKYNDWNIQLTNRGIIQRRLRKTLAYAFFAFALVAAFWARRSGKSLSNLIAGKLREGTKNILALLAGVIAKMQRIVR